jgi:hypothetical protein
VVDRVAPKDYLGLGLIYSCEQCSHFDPEAEKCTFGYDTSPHRKKNQDERYLLSGTLAYCRLIEID